ncbi:TIR domain-containing protein [Rhodococcus baikonurensis]|uniref:TIR domain-containing protein n=1 Tax=Rhodococcus baikonurensis TaxID=172041 RepID=A0ABV5XET8_9NOCA
MATRTVFYSFYYDGDVHRVQLVRNIGAIDGSPALGGQEWESVRSSSRQAVIKWIDDQMAYKRAVVVLIGQDTASRPWVKYEIEKAWEARKPLVGVRIHGLASMNGGAAQLGTDPFTSVVGSGIVPVFDPTRVDGYGNIDTKATYNNLARNLPGWVDRARARA